MSAATLRRIGLVVPSSNTTIETEVPQMLRSGDLGDVALTFHSSRAVLHNVDAESLDRMVADSDRCARELADARVDVLAYACLVAVMARGAGAHVAIESQLARAAAENGHELPVTSSAGALIRTLERMGARGVAIVTPYMPSLTDAVAAYIEASGDFTVVDKVSLSVADNVAVGRLDPMRLPEHVERMDLSDADVLITSACVQMPSLPAIESLERSLGMPVISAATATTSELIDVLGLPRRIPGAGALLRDGSPDAAPVAT
jgi:maleate isomerase